VTPDYFRLFGLTLVEGRLLDDRDGLAPNVLFLASGRRTRHRLLPSPCF
jgi:hypothetical protein